MRGNTGEPKTHPPMTAQPLPVDDVPDLDPARLAAANINPRTLLATDYLNHFNEAIMLLELLPDTPECIVELIGWEPLTYSEHFAASPFRDRELAIAAYEAAEPIARVRLDELADTMNALLAATCEALLRRSSLASAISLAAETAARLRPLVAQAGAVINGRGLGAEDITTAEQQAEVDALFDRGA
jgi:hypothetical protein